MSIDFNLTHLRYFHDAARFKSVALAAENNHVTSSTVSQAIRKLEQDLQVELLHHKKREFHLTDEGTRLLVETEKILVSIANFENEIISSKREPSGKLRFGSSHSIVSAFLLSTIDEMRREFPLVKPSLKLGMTGVLKTLLINREIDLAITLDDGSFQDFETIKIHQGNFIVIENQKIKANKEKYIITELRPEIEHFQELYRKINGHDLPVFFILDSWDLIIQAVEKGIGRGLVPDYILEKRNYKNIVPVKSGFKFLYQLLAIHRKNEKLSSLTNSFLKLILSSN